MNTRQFIANLAEQNVLPMDELAKMRRHLTPEQLEAAPDGLARELVRRRKITRFQAIQIIQGHGRSLAFGEYLVLDKIGEGGMGQVFKAEHRRMKRIVALKVLPPQTTNAKSLVDRFFKEVELAARLSHPNIVTAYDAGESRGLHYLVMEYIEGQTLSEHIKASGPLSVDQAMNCVLQAARGLDYAHAEGIIHRDIKPSNLMVNQRGVVKILDLGLARVEHSLAVAMPAGDAELTNSGQVLGTVDYMAPEQSYDSRAADHRSDIYSLGCTLYRLLTGHPPFTGETMMQKLLAHREQPAPSLREERSDVPQALDLLYQRMVAKLPDDRPRSMREIVFALESFTAGASEAESTVTHIPLPASDDEGLDSFLQRMSGSSGIGLGATSYSETPLPGSSGTIRTEASSGSASRPTRKKTAMPAGWILAAAASAAIMLGVGSWLSGRTNKDAEKKAVASKSSETKKEKKSKNQPDSPSATLSANTAPVAPQAEQVTIGALPANAAPTPAPVVTVAQQPVEPAMPMPDTPPTSQAPTDAINLFQKIDEAASVGTFTRDDKGLSAPAGATLRFALPMPEEYDLTAVLENSNLEGTCRLGLPVQKRATTFAFVRSSKSVWSLETAQQGWSAERAVALIDGPLTVLLSVRKDRVHVTFDGRTALDWIEQPGAPSLQSQLVGDDGRLCLFLQAKYRLTSLQLAAPSAKLPQYRAMDLLADVDGPRDRASGAVRVNYGDVVLETTAEQAGSCLSFAAERPTDYVLTAVVERLAGSDAFSLGLPTGMARSGPQLDLTDGSAQLLAVGAISTHPNLLLLTPWKLHRIVCTVRGDHLLRVEVDGSEVIQYQNRLTEDHLYLAPGVRDPAAFFVGAGSLSSFRVRRLNLAPLNWQKLPQPDTGGLAAAVEAIGPVVTAARGQVAKGDDRSPAARKLWREASQSDAPARRWALLDAAAQQAAADGDLGLTCHIVSDIQQSFTGDIGPLCTRVVPVAFRGAKTTTARQAQVVEALHQIEAALTLEEFDLAQALQAAAASVKSLPADLQREVKARGVEVDFLRAETAAGTKALAALAKDPALPAAHLAAGRYLAVVHGDWPAATTHFKQGGDEELAELAARQSPEAADNEPSAADIAAVGDRWWALSTKAATPLKWWYGERAAAWYRRALPISTSKIKTTIEGKLKSLTRQRKSSGDAFRLRHPVDAVQIGGRWYKFYPGPMSWKKAERVCRSLGGYLPIIKTADDNLAVVQAVAAGKAASERLTCWLGCSDEAKEGAWRWLDGTPVAAPGFLNWLNGEPDNRDGVEDFGAMLVWFENGEFKTQWSDDREVPYPFVCVWDD